MCDGRRKNFQRLPTVLILVGLILAFLACGCVSVRYALAEDGSGGGSFDYGVVYGPNSAAGLSDSDNPRYLVQVYAPNKYDAALIALGYNPASSSFTDDARAYLSNQSTGGAFYDFAQLFSNNNTDWGEEITTNPSLTPGINFDVTNMETALRINNSTYGASNVWSAEYSTSQRIAAVTAVGLVLSGSVGGSGGTPEQSGNYVVIQGIVPRNFFDSKTGWRVYDSMDSNSYTTYNLSNLYQYAANGMDIYIDVNDYNRLRSFITTGTELIFTPNWNYSGVTLYRAVTGTWNITNYANGQSWIYVDFYGAIYPHTKYWIDNGKLCVKLYDIAATFPVPDNMSTVSNNVRFTCWYAGITESGYIPPDGEPVVPPTNWPDPPENPTVDPPSVPDPPIDEPIQQPTDTPIQPPNVWTPIVSPTDPTFTVDLQGILDALATHCQHIRDNLDGNFAQLYNNMTDYWSRKYTNFKQFLDGQFGYVGDTIVDKTDDLMDYLKDLFEWLAEQFDWSVTGTGYNDNTVVSWLRKIYNRLGGGTTIKPPDPVVDPKGTGDWLSQLLENLVNELLGLGQDVLADLVESFRELITKFPFSIPWDIAAILALLVAEPQAPVLEIPQYTYTGVAIQQVGAYRLDLSEWDSVMEVVRPMETILFAGWLAFKTDFFKGLLELTKG